MRRAVLLAATMAIVAVLAVGMASADPVNSKNLQIYELDCGGELVTVSTIFNNNSIVVHEVGTTGNFVATRIAGTFTFTSTIATTRLSVRSSAASRVRRPRIRQAPPTSSTAVTT